MTDQAATANRRRYLTPEEKLQNLEHEVLASRSRVAIKRLSVLDAGQKLLRGLRALRSVVKTPGDLEPELVRTISLALEKIATHLAKLDILPEHILPDQPDDESL